MIENRYPSARRYVADPERNGEPFPVGMCKQRTRLAFNVPSDGADDASEAWSRTDHRVPGNLWVAGMLLWWLGGSSGHGHVAFADAEPGMIWTVDYPRAGHWNRVQKHKLEEAWSSLRYAGASLDIDGVQVVPALPPLPPKMPRVDHAISDLIIARDARKPGPVRKAIRETLQTLRKIKRGEIR